jgi:phosphate transport system substrate-binding protein
MKRLLPLVLALLLLTACNRAGSNLIVAGSTSVQPFVEVLAEDYAARFPGNEIDVQGGGSTAGIMAVENGISELGMSSRALKENELHLWSIEIAKDALAAIVHPGNPVGGLTLAQLRGIYSGTITNWRDLGGADARIHVIAREEGSGTRAAFEEMVMGPVRITPRAIVQDSNGAIRQLVAGDRNSIGFISMGLVDDTVKAVRIEGVTATFENVVEGRYALYRPFLLVSAEPPAGKADLFIGFILSPYGQALLKTEGLVPTADRIGGTAE